MSRTRLASGAALLLLFVLSGFAALVYQSIWTHYLGLTLGHAAYAQTLVLAIFMGGMAGGAWLASRWSSGLHRLILAYALIEALIGVAGLVFHPVFVSYTAFSQDTVLPAIASPAWSTAWQWLSAASLILPQCLLLGATFPLLSAGYLRLAPTDDGRVLGGLYFSNSIGAGFGALIATFVLLPSVGMPGAMQTAGALNLVVAAGAWAISTGLERREADITRPRETPVAPATAQLPRLLRIMLVATFLSSAFSFVYEIGWIRMLNQALGSTIHSFELMLAAFIFGLAFGGLWIRQRSARITDAVSMAAFAQIAMGLAALVSVVVFTRSFSWVGWLMSVLQRTPEAYTVFNLSSAGIALLVMFPAAFFAGMTLPLFTMVLLRHGAGESSIGRVYAANTLGAIIGVMLAVHVLIPLVGLRLAVTAAATGDTLLGLYLLRFVSQQGQSRAYAYAGLLAFSTLIFSLIGGQVDPRQQASGVFRHGIDRLEETTQVAFLRDGKTATVSVTALTDTNGATIATNGKPDAGLALSLETPPRGDEVTMLMLGSLPLALHSAPQDIAVIGWGSGLSTHTLLGSPVPRQVDTIEIEPAMWTGARLFGDRVRRAYEDPRSRVIFDDARTHFSSSGKRYDVIVSEPSNPWVSGVAHLFTQEFYRFLRRHLSTQGLLVQWLHSYEIGDDLLAQMIGALLEEFPFAEVYVSNSTDLILVAGQEPIPALSMENLRHPPLAAELERVGLASLEDYRLRRMGGTALLRAFTELFDRPSHSDFYPTVALQAPMHRFTQRNSELLQQMAWNGLPLQSLIGESAQLSTADQLSPSEFSAVMVKRLQAAAICRSLTAGSPDPQLDTSGANVIMGLLELSRRPLDKRALTRWLESVYAASSASLGLCDDSELAGSWVHPRWVEASEQPELVGQLLQAYSAAANRDREHLLELATGLLQEHAKTLPAGLNDQLLSLAMAAAVGLDRPELARELNDSPLRTSGTLASVRAFLLAWAATR